MQYTPEKADVLGEKDVMDTYREPDKDCLSPCS